MNVVSAAVPIILYSTQQDSNRSVLQSRLPSYSLCCLITVFIPNSLAVLPKSKHNIDVYQNSRSLWLCTMTSWPSTHTRVHSVWIRLWRIIPILPFNSHSTQPLCWYDSIFVSCSYWLTSVFQSLTQSSIKHELKMVSSRLRDSYSPVKKAPFMPITSLRQQVKIKLAH